MPIIETRKLTRLLQNCSDIKTYNDNADALYIANYFPPICSVTDMLNANL